MIYILGVGYNLLSHIAYVNKYGHIAYKSNRQARKGTRATGNNKNSLYRIQVPFPSGFEPEPCNNYQQRGYCKFGSSCKFSHTEKMNSRAYDGGQKSYGSKGIRRKKDWFA